MSAAGRSVLYCEVNASISRSIWVEVRCVSPASHRIASASLSPVRRLYTTEAYFFFSSANTVSPLSTCEYALSRSFSLYSGCSHEREISRLSGVSK